MLQACYRLGIDWTRRREVRRRHEDGFATGPGGAMFSPADGPDDDTPLAEIIEHLPCENDTLVRLHGQFAQPVYRLSIVACAERSQAQVRSQFQQVFTAGLLAGGILWPARWVETKRLGDPLQHHLVGWSVRGQSFPRITLQAELYGEAQPVGIAAALADQR